MAVSAAPHCVSRLSCSIYLTLDPQTHRSFTSYSSAPSYTNTHVHKCIQAHTFTYTGIIHFSLSLSPFVPLPFLLSQTYLLLSISLINHAADHGLSIRWPEHCARLHIYTHTHTHMQALVGEVFPHRHPLCDSTINWPFIKVSPNACTDACVYTSTCIHTPQYSSTMHLLQFCIFPKLGHQCMKKLRP